MLQITLQKYGFQLRKRGKNNMELSKVILSRRSIRSFKSNPVSNEQITALINAAIYAPSAGNCQPWHFFVIKDTTVKNRICEEACRQSFIASAPVVLVICINPVDSKKRYGERGCNLYSIQDTAAAVQNILLSAADLGLGACWCGAFDENKLEDILELKDGMTPVAIIPVGYAATEPMAPKRKSIEEVTTFIGEYDNKEFIQEKNERKIEHCDMSGVIFHDVNLGNSVFHNINLGSVDISDANLSDGEIHNCNLSNLKIYDCLLDGLSINGIEIAAILEKNII